MSTPNPFADLIPKAPSPAEDPENAFADLVPGTTQPSPMAAGLTRRQTLGQQQQMTHGAPDPTMKEVVAGQEALKDASAGMLDPALSTITPEQEQERAAYRELNVFPSAALRGPVHDKAPTPEERQFGFDRELARRGIPAPGPLPEARAIERSPLREAFDSLIGSPTGVPEGGAGDAIIAAQAARAGMTLKEYKEQVGARTGIGERYLKDIGSGAVYTGAGMLGAVSVASDFAKRHGLFGTAGADTNAGGLKEAADIGTQVSEEMMPSDPQFMDNLMAGFGSSLGFYVPGVGIAASAQALGRVIPAMALTYGAGASAALEASVEGYSVYRDMISQGKSEEEAQNAAAMTFASNVPLLMITERLGLFGQHGSLAQAKMMSALMEGPGQELPQQMISNWQTGKPLMEGTGESAAIGAIIGGVLGGTAPKPLGKKPSPTAEPPPPEEAQNARQPGATPSPADAFADLVPSQASPAAVPTAAPPSGSGEGAPAKESEAPAGTTPPVTYADDRLGDEGTRTRLADSLNQTDWMTGALEQHNAGKKTPLTAEDATTIAQKALAGEKIGPRQRKLLGSLLDNLPTPAITPGAEGYTGEERRAEGPERQERRQDTEQRTRVDQMTPEEMRQALLTHELTGIPNRRAYEEAEPLPFQGSVDADSLKWFNDHMSTESGDEMLKTIASALHKETPEAYHVSGDEFMVQGNTEQEIEQTLARVRQLLEKAVVEITKPDGTIIRKTGLEITHGIGKTKAEADARLKQAKTEREAAGTRAARGEPPRSGLLQIAPEGKQDQQDNLTGVTKFDDKKIVELQSGNEKENSARPIQDATLQNLAQHGGQVQKPEQPVVSQLRGEGDQGSPGMGGELSGIRGSGGTETVTDAHAGQEGQQPGIPAGKRALADQERAGAQHEEKSLTDAQRKNTDFDRLGGGDRSGSIDTAISPETGRNVGGGSSNNGSQVGAPTAEQIDSAANEAATSPTNNIPEPTEAQKEAGNYKVGKISIHGLDISIENPKGSTRSGVDKSGKPWSQELKHHYGYIRRTEGSDGDHVDVFVGPNPESDRAFIVDQIVPETGAWDEHKVLLGFEDVRQAEAGYKSNYQKGWKGLKHITPVSVEELKTWLKSGNTKEMFASAEAGGKNAQQEPGAGQTDADLQPQRGEGVGGEARPDVPTPEGGEGVHGGRSDEERALAAQAALERIQLFESWKQQMDEAYVQALVDTGISTDTSDASHQWFKFGWDHAMRGKTKSNLPQGYADAVTGYEKAYAWLQTEYGKQFSKGIKGKKAQGTGAQLRRPQDDTKRRIDDLEEVDVDGEVSQMIADVDQLTVRSEVFSPQIGEDATPGTKRALDIIRGNIIPFKDHALHKLFYSRRGRKGTTSKLERYLDSNPKTQGQYVDLAREYITNVSEIAREFDGAKSVDDVLKVINEKFVVTKVIDGKWKSQSDTALAGTIPLRRSFSGFLYKVEREKAGEEKEMESKRKTPLTPPKLDRVDRTEFKDYREGRNVTAQELKDTFGFADITIGEWGTSQQRQDHMNYAFDALHDLAETLDIEPKDVSLGGTLYLAFGALGRGKAAAHYSPNHPHPSGKTVQVMNLTVTRGDGTLGHEWVHAVDYHLRAQHMGGYSVDKQSPIVANLVSRLRHKMVTRDEIKRKVNNMLEGNQFWTHIRKKGESPRVSNARYTIERFREELQRSKRLQVATGNYAFKTTEYASQANKLGIDYWANKEEMVARAGESYFYDVMKGESNYLVNDWVEADKVAAPIYRGAPYPGSKERSYTNDLFREFFNSLDWDKTGPKQKEKPEILESFTQQVDDMLKYLDELDGALPQNDEIMRAQKLDEEEEKARQENAQRTEQMKQDMNHLFGVDEQAPAGPALEDEIKGMSEDELSDLFDDVAAEAEEATQEPGVSPIREPATEPARALVDSLMPHIGKKLSWQQLFDLADKAYGGTQAAGAYTPKDAYDALEVAMNQYIRQKIATPLNVGVEGVEGIFKSLDHIDQSIPTQTKRTEEQDDFQQFSTPHTYAYTMARVAAVRSDDVVLEPSAGTGNLATLAEKAGPKGIIVNELSPRRGALLRLMGFDHQYSENAEQINNILPRDVRPTVVIMNPPFSNSATRGVMKDTKIGARHVEQTLKRLQPGGRLVALVGQGMAMNRPAFRSWWDGIRKEYNVRANIGIDGSGYAKFGTSFDNQLLVIDKTGPTVGDIVMDDVKSIHDVIPLLEGIRNDRTHPGERFTTGSGVQAEAGEGSTGSRPGESVLSPDYELGTGDRSPGDETGAGIGPEGYGQPAAGVELESGAELPGGTARGSGIDTAEPGRTGKPGTDRGRRKPAGDTSRSDGGKDRGVQRPGGLTEDQQQTAGSLIKEAARHGVTGINEALTGLAELFGGNKIKSFPAGFDEETYKRAKPHFEASLKAFIEAGKTLKEFIRFVIDNLGTNAKPYFMQFMKEQQAMGGIPNQDASSADSVEIQQSDNKAADSALTDSVFDSYRPAATIKGAKPHPGKLVESAAMAASKLPKVDYVPNLPKDVIDEGKLSDAQIEAIIYAGAAHSQKLENGLRRGFLIGDGTGVGKGREISGIILDNMRQGRKKAVWISEKSELFKDAQRDFSGVGADKDKLFELSKLKPGRKDGILYTTYSTLKSAAKDVVEGNQTIKGKTRLEQVKEWLGEDFDGVIVFDEAHSMGNNIEIKGFRGKKKPSQAAVAGLALQDAFPNARIVYVSATSATEVHNLGYCERLGLWGKGTPFPDKPTFINKISSGGIAAMELIAKDMKSMGVYLARSLSYDDVTYGMLEHTVTPEQNEIYNLLADAWQIVLKDIKAVMEITEADKDPKARAQFASQFWGAHQRFFNQVITAMQMPAVLKSIESELEKGNVAVLQLVNTMEEAQKRAVARMVEEDGDIEDIDITPREMLLQYVENSYPIAQYETYLDENGNEKSRIVLDSQGNPVSNKEAIERRDALLDKLGSIRVPDSPLDSILNHFGSERVAEITGRSRRFVRFSGKTVEEKLTPTKSMADADAFMNGRKDILIFSDKGGTGRSYHADLTAKNQKRRIHYLVQPGWRADKAVQGFGRTHRSNEASAPHYFLVTTNLKAQRRFLSSIARRLDQLGALSKGQRQTGSQGILSSEFNLENQYATTGLLNFLKAVRNQEIDGIDMATIEDQMGLKIVDKDGNITPTSIPNIPQFLNRLLSLRTDLMDRVFDGFFEKLTDAVQNAKDNGTFDVGMENIVADSVTKIHEQIVYTDPGSRAETKYVELELSNRLKPTDFNRMMADALGRQRPPLFFAKNKKSGRTYAFFEGRNLTKADTGQVVERYRMVGPYTDQQVERDSIGVAGRLSNNLEELTDLAVAKAGWDHDIETLPNVRKSKRHLITGTLLPIWDRLVGLPNIMRVQTDEGERMIGRLVIEKDLDETLRNLGVSKRAPKMTPAEAVQAVKDGATLVLSNGWRIGLRVVSNEPRIEINGPNYSHIDDLKSDGVFTERVNYTTRFFIPTDEKGPAVLEKITKHRQIVDLVQKEGDMLQVRRPKTDELPDPGRRRFVMTAAAALAGASPIGMKLAGKAMSDVKLGRAAPIDPAVLAQRITPRAEAVLRAASTGKMTGAQAMKEALRDISETGPVELRPLAREILQLAPDKYVNIKVDDTGLWNAEGAVSLKDGIPTLNLFTAEGRTGLSNETFLHEALHMVVAARYRSLSTGVLRENDKTLKQDAPKATVALEQLRRVWEEYRAATEGQEFQGNPALQTSLYQARGNIDEFFVRSLTDPYLQDFLSRHEYRGKTLLRRFVDWVKKFLFGLGETGNIPSWLDAALMASNDLLTDMMGDKSDFSTLNAINDVLGRPRFDTQFQRRRQTGNQDLDAALEKIGARSVGLKERFDAMREDLVERINQGQFDRFAAIKNAEDDVHGDQLATAERSYVAARMTTSLPAQMHVALMRGPLMWGSDGQATFNPKIKGLLQILEPVSKNLDLWEAYMVGKRAQRLMGEGREKLFTDSQIREMVALGAKHPEFQQVAQDWARFNSAMLDFAEGAGLIDHDARVVWQNDDYIPFFRITEEDFVRAPRGGAKELANRSAGIRQLRGGTSNLNDILENMLMNTAHLIGSSMANNAAALAVSNLEGTQYLTKIPSHVFKPAIVSMDSVKKVLEANGVNTAGMPPAVLEGFQKLWSLNRPEGKNIIRVMFQGKPRYYTVHDPLLLRALTSINQVAWSKWMKLFSAPKRLLTNMVTMDPSFMARNFIRDTLQAFVIARDPMVPVMSSLKGLVEAMRNDDDLMRIWAAGGGFHGGYLNAGDPQALGKEVKAMMRKKGINVNSIVGTPIKLWEIWQDFGSKFENANRIAAYKAAKRAGKTDLEASFEAKDFMDFSMHGDWAIVQFLVHTVPFFGARVQGLHRLGRGAMENPTGFAAKGMLVMLAGLALYLKYWDDDRYKKLEDWDKNTYYHFWVDGHHFRIPKPFEVGAIFGTIPERITEAFLSSADDKYKELLKQFGWVIANTFNVGSITIGGVPVPAPQTVVPLLEDWANIDTFTQRPILNFTDEGLLPQYQYDYYTSETAIEIGQALGLSPKRIEHYIRGYLGTLGGYALGATDVMTRRMMDYPNEPTLRLQDMPVIRSFYRGDDTASYTKFQTDFYDLMDETDKLVRTYNRLRKSHDPEAEGFRDENLPGIRAHKGLEEQSRRISSINRRIRDVHHDTTMTPDEKRDELNGLIEKKNAIFESAVTRANRKINESTATND